MLDCMFLCCFDLYCVFYIPRFNDTDTDTDQPVYSTTREPGSRKLGTDQPVPTRAPGTKCKLH